MRMKDVCERTGLTDRAVRLYMESGLISPHEEQNYMGRRSISFDEEDVRALEAVATLRRAELSISDIAAMKATPDALPSIVERHRAALKEDIHAKQDVLSTLERLNSTICPDYLALADAIRTSASSQRIPKEDLQMNERDVKRFIRSRIPALIALVLLLIGMLTIVSLVARTAFADVDLIPHEKSHNTQTFRLQYVDGRHPFVFPSDGYTLTFDVSLDATRAHAALLLAAALTVATCVLMVIYLCRAAGKRLLLSSLVLCLLAILLLLIAPTEQLAHMRWFEFLDYYTYAGALYFPKMPTLLIQSFKFIPLLAACVLSAIGIRKHEPLNES